MENKIKAKKVVQNNQEFLLGIFKISQVQNFTKYTERLIVGFKEVEEEDRIYSDQTQILPDYNPQIQRKTNNLKVEKIADFLITDPSAMFPTNIVIAIPLEVIDSKIEDENNDTIIVLNSIVKEELEKENGDVFLTIIDGQHRIKGIERAIERLNESINEYKSPDNVEKTLEFESNKAILKRLLNLELIVTFFIDPILEYQAMIFSTINKTQTKVPENLVFSLFGLTKDDTPQKTSLEVVLALNGIVKSPFYNRIKLVGGNYKRNENIPLSQATMVKSILYNISKNQRDSEIERNKERKDLKNNPNNLKFRLYYANNNDKMIIRIMYSFFSAVRSTFTNNDGVSYWDIDSTNETNVLQTNVGYQALMKILIDILSIIPEDKKDDKNTYIELLKKAKDINWEDNGEEKRYPFTSRSIKILYTDLKDKIGL
ncbi:DGQHR domain-containing protein [Flavobacterium hydatis]|nr:DGQHR domain-containing protein [Flavobacterium hydatis]